MNARNDLNDIPKEKFNFVQRSEKIHDTKFETKPIGYFMDAWIRFRKNKGSVVAAIIILAMVIFSIVVPVFSPYSVISGDAHYKDSLPRSEFFSQFGFWTGSSKKTVNTQTFDLYDATPGAVTKVYDKYTATSSGRTNIYYDIELDSYAKVGFKYYIFTQAEIDQILAYQEETGKQIFYPVVDESKIVAFTGKGDANYWFLHDGKGNAIRDARGNLQNIYLTDENSPDGYDYFVEMQGGYRVRVLYSEYYNYVNGHYASFLFGADLYGKDILTCLASGAQLSLILGFCVALINFFIGSVYGAVEGYYGGTADLVMERISDVLSAVPFIIVATLFQLHLARAVGPFGSLVFAFVLTGWIGTASRVRSQFYRFKGQEYVLAARTLGAKDSRIIFRHIYPNALGTIVTSSVLMIPGVIFTESSLSYLGIVNLENSNITSLGTLLSNGQGMLRTFPHEIFFPALFISLLMISFNLFGNGLRDAFNPSLRGADD